MERETIMELCLWVGGIIWALFAIGGVITGMDDTNKKNAAANPPVPNKPQAPTEIQKSEVKSDLPFNSK